MLIGNQPKIETLAELESPELPMRTISVSHATAFIAMSQPLPYPNLPPETREPRKPRNPGVAVLLAFLFGPLGLFYASKIGGFFMTFVCLVVGVGTVGVGLLFAWPVCILWAYVAAASESGTTSLGG